MAELIGRGNVKGDVNFMNDDVKAYEEKLIREFKEGNRERFDELVSSYGPKLYRSAGQSS